MACDHSMALTGTIPVELKRFILPWMAERSLKNVPAGGRLGE